MGIELNIYCVINIGMAEFGVLAKWMLDRNKGYQKLLGDLEASTLSFRAIGISV